MPDKGQQGVAMGRVEREFVAQYVLRKGERIAAAFTALGRLIGADDPYGKTFILLSHTVLEGCVAFANALIAGEGIAQARTDAVGSLQRARSHLSAAFYAGIVHEHNFLILQEEVSALLTRVNNVAESQLYALTESEKFAVANQLAVAAATRSPAAGSAEAPKQDIRRAEQQQQKSRNSSAYPAAPAGLERSEREEAKARREAILSIIGQKGRVSVRDLAEAIRGVSTKTIQRELNALIRDGLVLREGERRWSVYRLAG
jgi:hypothetical protein